MALTVVGNGIYASAVVGNGIDCYWKWHRQLFEMALTVVGIDFDCY